MALLVWTMVGLALWHFTIFLPDHFWGGIVGAFVGALLGSIIFGFAVHKFGMPARDDVDIVTAIECVPGTVIGLAAIYFLGLSRERRDPSFGR
jgi:hypothetical protein